MILEFYSYYTNRDNGLIGHIFSDLQEKESQPTIVRERTRDVFD